MYERILVALDGGEGSAQALRHAIELVRESRCQLRLLHVVDELGLGLGETPTPDAFWEAARQAGQRILAQATDRAASAGVEAEATLREIRTFGALKRRIADVIVDEARRWPADAIVIASHTRRPLRKMLVGSVAEGVIRASSVPVLLVPDAGSSDRAAEESR